MKSLAVIALSVLLSQAAFAKSTKPALCTKQAGAAAAKADKEQLGAEASDCGTKLLHNGDVLETYLVCVSDETDPSEWIVVMKKNVTDRSGNIKGHCKTEYTGYAVDSRTPDFDENGN